MRKRIIYLALLAFLALSCNPNQLEQPSGKSTVHVALDVSLEQTKALSADEDGITAGFAAGDKLYVFAIESASGVASDEYLGTLTNSQEHLNQFHGDLTVGYTASGDYKVSLYYNQRDVEKLKTGDKPAANMMILGASGYREQTKGTLADIAKNFDIAKGESTLHFVKETNTLSFNGPATLKANQAILKFTFCLAASGQPMDIKEVAFYYGRFDNTGKSTAEPIIEASLTDGTSRQDYFVALAGSDPVDKEQRYLMTFIVTAEDNKQYWGYKLLPQGFLPGKSYKSNVYLEKYDEMALVDLGLSVAWYNINATSSYGIVGSYDAVEHNGEDYARLQVWSPGIDTRSDWPSMDQYKELLNNTSHEWLPLNIVDGYVFRSKKTGFTNRFIYFPSCDVVANQGKKPEDDLKNGYSGHYWTSSYIKRERMPDTTIEFYFDGPRNGTDNDFDSGSLKLVVGNRNYAMSLRKIGPLSAVPPVEGAYTTNDGYNEGAIEEWN